VSKRWSGQRDLHSDGETVGLAHSSFTASGYNLNAKKAASRIEIVVMFDYITAHNAEKIRAGLRDYKNMRSKCRMA